MFSESGRIHRHPIGHFASAQINGRAFSTIRVPRLYLLCKSEGSSPSGGHLVDEREEAFFFFLRGKFMFHVFFDD